jgi:RNA polymerase sigma-70 factor (ECF subfamily)
MRVEITDPMGGPHPDGLREPTDEQLVDRYQAFGCVESLNELLRRHLGPVRSLVFPMVLNPSTADDLTQEVFLRAIRGLKSFRGEAKFSTWLFRIAWNVVQSERSRPELSGRPPERWDSLASRSAGPDGVALQRELDQQIESGLAALSPKLRGALVLTSLQRLSPEEAAELEGCSISTMYWRIHEARRLMAERLAGYLAP